MTEDEALSAVNQAVKERSRGASTVATNRKIEDILSRTPEGKVKDILKKSVVK